MRGIFHKTSPAATTILAILTAVLGCGLVLDARPAWGVDAPTYTSTPDDAYGLGNPQGHFRLNIDEMPARENSLFPIYSAAPDINNKLEITAGSVSGNVYGGIAAQTGSAATDNSVTVKGAPDAARVTIGGVAGSGNVTGGWSHSGDLIRNSVTLENVTVRGNTYGGWKRGGTGGFAVQNNTVSVGDNVTLRDTIYGAYTQGSNDDVHNNSVTLGGSNIQIHDTNTRFIAGAYTGVSVNSVHNNAVTITDGASGNIEVESIFGGRGQSSSTVTFNTVSIGGNIVITTKDDGTPGIFGGHGMSGYVTHNNVTITGGDITASVYGGSSTSGTVTENHVTFSGGTITGDMYGGYARAGGAVTENDVTLSGGTITGDVYGGYSVSGVAIENEVTLNAGTFTGDIYGGFSGSGRDAFTGNVLNKNNAAIHVNEVHNFQNVNFGSAGDANIDLLDTTASGSSESGVTLSTGDHAITFDGTITGSGDLTKTGEGTLILTGDTNATDRNTIKHPNGVTVADGTLQIGNGGTVGNFTTPRFTVTPDATLAYDRNDTITYSGLITGAGTLEQKGGTGKTGTLVLTGNGSDVKNVAVTGGTLQIGNGDTYGSLAAETFDLSQDAALAYNRSDAVSYTGRHIITGAGKVVQRGGGSLLLNDEANPDDTTLPRNTFTGGTEIENGTLNIIDLTSYNQVRWSGMGSNLADANLGTKAGYITFTGQEGPKYAILRSGVISGSASLHNSFRTDRTAGIQNNVDLTAMPVVIRGNNLSFGSDKGGAFFVADDTSMNVKASQLILGGDNNGVGETYFNKSQDGAKNDLYIGQNAKFNLYVDDYATFNSGIGGETTSTGTLNLRPLVPSSSTRPYASVYLINNTSLGDPTPQTFHTGTTTVAGEADKALILYMTRGRIEENDTRVTFRNDDFFNLNRYALLTGDGTIEAGDAINITDGGLYPHAMSRHDMNYDEKNSPGTLLLQAPEINLTNFTMLYDIAGPQKALDTTQSGTGLDDVSNNSLLDFAITGPNKVTLNNGSVYFKTITGSAFEEADYLVMRSNNGFTDGTDEIDNNNVNSHLTAYIDGFTLDPEANSVRGGGMTFVMGGEPNDGSSDPDSSGKNTDTSSTKNIWLSAELNSLSMDWKGGTSAFDNDAEFDSEQITGTDENTREHSFMPGDKVYVSTAGDNIKLLSPGEAGSPDALAGISVTVSGLVVGKNTKGETTTGGSYTFSGGGGLTADADSAHGKYVNKDADKDDDVSNDNYGSGDILKPTGTLQKFGDSTLTFLNKGTNVFLEGIELSGGTTQFSRAEQLVDASYMKTQSNPDAEPTYSATNFGGTRFLENATLEALADVDLYNSITIDSGKTATLSAAEDNVFRYHGVLTGEMDTVLNKLGTGTLELFSDLDDGEESIFGGTMKVNKGVLDVQGSFAGAAVEVHGDNGGETLSGIGFLKTGHIFENGTLAPGTIEDPLNFIGDLAFDFGSHFNVSLENNGNPESEYVTVGGETTITSGAILNVAFDYWGSKGALGDIYRIIEATASQTDETSEFTLGGIASSLPRGLTMEQGWNLGTRIGQTNDEYQLTLVRDLTNGVDDIPDLTHNETEIGKVVDNLVDDPDGPLKDIVDKVTDRNVPDDEIRRRLNQLTGDLTTNALYLAFKEPWRHPFNRLTHNAAAPCVELGSDTRLWAELPARYEEADSDGNAHDFSIRRYGVALGLDRQVSPRLTFGANLQFTRPTLKQDTGRVTADDLELGVYGMAAVTDNLDLKAYLGYSWQNYDFKRTVFLPASAVPGDGVAFHENLTGETDGRALSASLELIRPIDLRPGFRLSPLAALDYENVRVDGYRESGGLAALVYDDMKMDRLTLRAGLSAEYAVRDRATLTARAQYGYRAVGQEYPSTDVHFAADPLAHRADIRGVASGRHSLYLGLGANIKLGDRDNSLLYLNYDARLNNRTVTHAAEVGFMLAW